MTTATDTALRVAFPSRLSRPLPLYPIFVEDELDDMSAAELGSFIRVAVHWWEWGRLPEGRQVAAVIGVRHSRAKEVLARLAPHFEPGSYLAVLREATLVKVRRRAKAGSKGAARTHRAHLRLVEP